jgi:hypothetical protein
MPSHRPIPNLKHNDIIAIDRGTARLISRVVGNNGESITWHYLKWLEASSENYSYEQCKTAKVQHIGTYRPFWKRLLTLNSSKVEYL